MFGQLVPDHWDARIAVHFAHRVGAAIVTLTVLWLSSMVWLRFRARHDLLRPALLLLLFVAMQVTLGALTILSRRDPWINSFHVVCGALVLATSLVLTLRTWRGAIADYVLRRAQDAPSLSRGGLRIADLTDSSGFADSANSADPNRNPQSAIRNPQPAIRNPQPAIRNDEARA
jgi:cytochrome c oxidase assembly protein subunit 15